MEDNEDKADNSPEKKIDNEGGERRNQGQTE